MHLRFVLAAMALAQPALAQPALAQPALMAALSGRETDSRDVARASHVPSSPAIAPRTGLRIQTGAVERDSSQLRVRATVAWKNAWRNDRNHDAVWVFAKLRAAPSSSWRHARLRGVTSSSPTVTCRLAADNIGAFCAPSRAHRGDISVSVTLDLALNTLSERDRVLPTVQADVHGIEMVYIPGGAFSIGDPDPRSVEFAAYYRSDANGGHAGPLRITSEGAIRVAPEAGALYYKTPTPQYQGDRLGPIPAEFPKGTRAFYAMKYEILQGQYAAFLNAIGPEPAQFRAIHGGVAYYEERGSIRIDKNMYVADHPDRPANWVSWDDGIAFADWAGLRPMTEFEFTKAARGPVEPGRAEFPWGTNSRERLLRRVGPDHNLVQSGAADESRLTDATRDQLGASFFWVMDLAGSVWERVVSAGHPRGRAFQGTHGDGQLAAYGIATNADWPSGDSDGGGYGYRGGGYYERDRERAQSDREFNPYSPVAWRPYGAWGGAPRSVAYGFRAVRTAER